MRTFIFIKDGVARVARTYALGPGGRTITPDIEGTMEELVPAPDMADEIKRWRRENEAGVTSVREIAEADIPDDASFKEAWRDDGEKVVVDMSTARAIHMDRIREARDRELAALDFETMRAVGAGDDAKRDEVETRKQALRDIPQTFDLSQAKTPDELKDLWPEELD